MSLRKVLMTTATVLGAGGVAFMIGNTSMRDQNERDPPARVQEYRDLRATIADFEYQCENFRSGNIPEYSRTGINLIRMAAMSAQLPSLRKRLPSYEADLTSFRRSQKDLGNYLWLGLSVGLLGLGLYMFTDMNKIGIKKDPDESIPEGVVT